MAQQAGEELKSILKKTPLPNCCICCLPPAVSPASAGGKGFVCLQDKKFPFPSYPLFQYLGTTLFCSDAFCLLSISFPLIGNNLPKRTVVPRRLQSSILGANSPYTWVKDWEAVGIFLQQLFSSGNPGEGLKLCMNGGYTRQFLAKKRLEKVKKKPNKVLCMANLMPTTPQRSPAQCHGWMKPSASASPSSLNVTNPQTKEVCKEREIK